MGQRVLALVFRRWLSHLESCKVPEGEGIINKEVNVKFTETIGCGN